MKTPATALLDGGGVGCVNETSAPTDHRKIYHHLTFYGFLLCFAALHSRRCITICSRAKRPTLGGPPVVLGTLGGIGLLLALRVTRGKIQRDPALIDASAPAWMSLHRHAVPDESLPVLRSSPGATAPRWGPCWRCISAWCSRCSSRYLWESSCTVFNRTVALVRYARERRMMGMVGGGRRPHPEERPLGPRLEGEPALVLRDARKARPQDEGF